MKKILLAFLVGISFVAVRTTDAEASEIEGTVETEEVVPNEIPALVNDETPQISPYMWAQQYITKVYYYSGRNARIPGVIWHSQGSQSGKLYLTSKLYNEKTKTWKCGFGGWISGYI